MKKLLMAILFVVTPIFAEASLGDLPIQDAGRIKPFDTFAREVLSLTWGKESFRGRPATDVVFSWMLVPEEWDKQEFILIRHAGLREALKFDGKRLHYSPTEILMNERVQLHMQELQNKRQAQEKLDPFFQAVQTLENQVSYYHAVRTGLGLRLMPKEGTTTWANATELVEPYAQKFRAISEKFVSVAAAQAKGDNDGGKSAREALNLAVKDFVDEVSKKHGDYSTAQKIRAEVHYNSTHPFRWAWIAYLFALVFFSVAYSGGRDQYLKAAWVVLGIGFLFHTWGFALRVYILERPPVTNMYETVVWVAWVALLFAAIIYRWGRAKIMMVAASLLGTLSLILCDVSSSVLDDTLQPLEPVLRDNFWLVVHVIVIVSSYAAFFLAFVIGDIVLYYFIKDENRYQQQISHAVQAIYRSLQVGVVLIAAGTILGGVWADYSWGRFWGWDPKETWAFIVLMGYIIVLHGRIAGWLRNFGLAVASVLGFSLVIMAWYGVNFVLGAGLHTYGFGAGGVEYVSAFVAIHFLYVAYAVTLRQTKLKNRDVQKT